MNRVIVATFILIVATLTLVFWLPDQVRFITIFMPKIGYVVASIIVLLTAVIIAVKKHPLTDRWLFWPALAFLVIVIVITFFCRIPGPISFLMILLSPFCYAIVSIVILTAAVVFAVKKHPRRALSLFLVLITPVLLFTPIKWVADCIHLGLNVGIGIKQLGPPIRMQGSEFVANDWSVGFAGGPSTFLIHDETDEVLLPMDQHTHPSTEYGFKEKCAGKVSHLLGHYYICTF